MIADKDRPCHIIKRRRRHQSMTHRSSECHVGLLCCARPLLYGRAWLVMLRWRHSQLVSNKNTSAGKLTWPPSTNRKLLQPNLSVSFKLCLHLSCGQRRLSITLQLVGFLLTVIISDKVLLASLKYVSKRRQL